jgi:5-methylthioadenosine/S-adenosylhomocysteine deaminase
MQAVDTIIYPRWLVTVDEGPDDGTRRPLQDPSLENYGVVIDKGEILAVAHADQLKSGYKANSTIALDNHVLIPGLVNTHTHAAMTLFRGYADDIPLMQWLSEHIWPAEAQWVDEKFVEAGTNLACAEMIRGGTTCFNDMYFFPDVVARQAEKSGLRACVGMIVVDFPTVWAPNADEYINRGLAMRDQFRHSSLVTAAFAPHAPYTVSDEPLSRISTLAEELDCPVHIHLHETRHEIEESSARFGMRPIERLEQLGLLGPRLVAVHMTHLLDGEIETLAERGVNVVHCPESNLKLASGSCPVGRLLSCGVNVALGTDSASSNNDLDMIGEMRTASLLAKGVSESPVTMNAYETLRAATLNGAKALGLDHLIGSVEPGKQADLVAIDLWAPATQPTYHPVSQLVYSASRDQVSDVWIAGNRVLADRELVTMDENRILAVAREWKEKIQPGQVI